MATKVRGGKRFQPIARRRRRVRKRFLRASPDAGALEAMRSATPGRGKRPAAEVELARLRRRNERLEAELAKTRSALDVMGKLHALLEELSESADTDPKSTR